MMSVVLGVRGFDETDENATDNTCTAAFASNPTRVLVPVVLRLSLYVCSVSTQQTSTAQEEEQAHRGMSAAASGVPHCTQRCFNMPQRTYTPSHPPPRPTRLAETPRLASSRLCACSTSRSGHWLCHSHAPRGPGWLAAALGPPPAAAAGQAASVVFAAADLLTLLAQSTALGRLRNTAAAGGWCSLRQAMAAGAVLPVAAAVGAVARCHSVQEACWRWPLLRRHAACGCWRGGEVAGGRAVVRAVV